MFSYMAPEHQTDMCSELSHHRLTKYRCACRPALAGRVREVRLRREGEHVTRARGE